MAFAGAGGVNLGTAYGTIGVQFADDLIQSSLRALDNTISGSLKSIGQKFQSVGAELSVGLAPVSAFVGKGVLSFMAFDDVLTEIEARTGATATEMERVRQASLKMGQDTAFSASEAAQGILELLASGMSLEDAFVAIGPVLDAAAASNMGLGETAAAVTTILSQFRLPASEAARVANALAQAAAASRAEMGDLAQGFGNVGPIAAEFGLSVEQTAAILGVFANKGIEGAEAGTQLKSMLTNMMRPTEDVQGMWKQLGVSMFDAQGNMRDINDIIADLNVAMEGMSDQERLNVINTLAGSYGQMGLSALLAEGGVGKMMTKMSQQATASDVAKKKMEAFRGVVDTLMSTVETFSINILGPMVEKYLEPMLKSITDIINKGSEWAAANPGLAAKLGLVLAVLSGLGPVLIFIGTIFSLIGTAVAGFAGAIAFLLSPLGLLIALFVALGAAYATNFLGFQDFVDSLLPLLKAGFEELINIFNRLKAAFEEGGLGGVFEQLKTEIENNLPVILDVLKTLGSQFIEKIKEGLPKVWDWVKTELLDPIWAELTNPANWVKVGNFLLDVLTFIGEVEIAAATWVKEHILDPLWDEVTKQENWVKVGNFLLDVLTFIASAVVDFAGWVNTHVLAPLWEQVTKRENWQKVGSFISSVLGFIAEAAVDFLSWVNTHILSPIWEQIDNTQNWVAVGEFIGKLVKYIAENVPDWLAWVNDNILSPIWNNLTSRENWTNAYNFIKDLINYVAENAPDWLAWVNDNILQPMLNAINLLIHTVGPAVVDGIKTGINDAWSGLTSWFEEKAGGLIGGFMKGIGARSPSRLFADAAAFIPQGIALGINENMKTALDALGNMTGQLGMLAPTAMTPALAPVGVGGGGQITNYDFSGMTFQLPPEAAKNPEEFGKRAHDKFMVEHRKRGGGMARA